VAKKEVRECATLVERWLEQGRQKGLEEGSRQAAFRHVLQILEHRAGKLPEALTVSLQTIDTSALETLLGVALSTSSLEAFAQHPLLADA